MTRSGLRPAAALVLAAACSHGPDPGARPPASASAGVVVEDVGPGFAAARAGLREGDVLLSWRRAPAPPHAQGAEGAIRHPFDLRLLEIREAPRGPITLHGRRGAQALRVTLPPEIWELQARPRDPDAGAAPEDAAWRHYDRARRAAGARDWERANEAFAAAVAAAGDGGGAAVRAFLEREAGFALGRQARLAESRAAHGRALKLREAGGTPLEAAASRLDLGVVAILSGEVAAAEALFAGAREVVEREAPRSLALAHVLGFQGLARERRGDLAGHEALQARAVALLEDLDPRGRTIAGALHNLGDVVRKRGDYARAEALYRRSLAVKAGLPPDRGIAYTLLSLGHVARMRGDLAGARDGYRRGLDVVRAHGPDVTAEAALEVALGEVALDEGDAEDAGERFRAALAVFERAAPKGPGAVATLGRLGEVARLQGRYAEAAQRHGRALALAVESSPDGLDAARAHFHLGEVALDEQRLADAERSLRRARALQERAAPDTVAHAETLHRLGLAVWRRGRPADAAPLVARATAVLDAQQGRLGGDEQAAARFRGRFLRIYRDEMELLLALGRTDAAFDALERSRAVALRQMLAHRDLGRGTAPGAPGVLGEAKPLGRAGAAASLGEGTVALSYAVGPARTHVFVLGGAGGLRVAEVAAGEDALRAAIERFRLLLAAPGPGPEARDGLLRRGEELFGLLVAPVEDAVASARAVVVVPDGPLHLLPFAALVRRDGAGARRYLAESTPVHAAASLTAHALLARGASAGPGGLLAFGDPRPAASARPLPALPASRREVEAVAAAFPPPVRAYVGADATESRVKAGSAEARILHFALHGVLDDALPMDSGLVLARGAGADDGFLQGWEIVEQLHLSADLVTLSACDTALGSPLPGEGIVGLTSAFQHAGARSVLASLWKVSDRSTAALMERFYRHLSEGRDASRALQAAQAELIHGPAETAHPFHWAAFALHGAPR